MRCKTVLRDIDDHVDGLLPARTAEKVRRHLDDCESCRTEAEATRAATTPLSAWGDLEPPDGCFESILARIDQLPLDARDRGGLRGRAAFPRVLRGRPVFPGALHARAVHWLVTGSLAAAAAVMVGLALEAPRPSPMRLGRPSAANVLSAGFAPTVMAGAVVPPFEPAAIDSPRAEPMPVFGGGLRARKVFVEGSAADPAEELPLPFPEGPR